MGVVRTSTATATDLSIVQRALLAQPSRPEPALTLVNHSAQTSDTGATSPAWSGSSFPYQVIGGVLVTVMALGLLAAVSYQCAATWRWLRGRALRSVGVNMSSDGCPTDDENSALSKQAAIRISHSLPDLQTEPLKPEYVQDHKDSKKTQKMFVIDRFEGICEGSEDIAMTLHNISLTRDGKLVKINAKLVVNHDLIHQIEQTLILIRCRNKESLDTCENYHNMRFAKCCELLNTEKQLWSPFIESIHPRIRCPVKSGTYSIEDATLDATVPLFTLDGWYWRVNVRSYDVNTREPLLCLNVEGETQNVRKIQE